MYVGCYLVIARAIEFAKLHDILGSLLGYFICRIWYDLYPWILCPSMEPSQRRPGPTTLPHTCLWMCLFGRTCFGKNCHPDRLVQNVCSGPSSSELSLVGQYGHHLSPIELGHCLHYPAEHAVCPSRCYMEVPPPEQMLQSVYRYARVRECTSILRLEYDLVASEDHLGSSNELATEARRVNHLRSRPTVSVFLISTILHKLGKGN